MKPNTHVTHHVTLSKNPLDFLGIGPDGRQSYTIVIVIKTTTGIAAPKNIHRGLGERKDVQISATMSPGTEITSQAVAGIQVTHSKLSVATSAHRALTANAIAIHVQSVPIHAKSFIRCIFGRQSDPVGPSVVPFRQKTSLSTPI